MILLWIALGLCALYLFLVFPRLPRRPLGELAGWEYAHRGLWNEQLPENSRPAFRAAVANGFGMETDVHITRDDQLVVFHDDTLQRMCGVEGRLSDCTLAELRALRLKGTDETIPTLDEFLEIAGGRVPLIVELKSDSRIDTLCALADARLRQYSGPYCIESFDPRAVRWWRRHHPEILRGQLAFGLRNLPREERTAQNRLTASLIQNVLGRPDFIAFDALSDQGISMRVMRLLRPTLVAWTVRSQEQMDALRSRYDLQIFEGFLPRKEENA